MNWNSPFAMVIALVFIVPAIIAIVSVEIDFLIKRLRARRSRGVGA